MSRRRVGSELLDSIAGNIHLPSPSRSKQGQSCMVVNTDCTVEAWNLTSPARVATGAFGEQERRVAGQERETHGAFPFPAYHPSAGFGSGDRMSVRSPVQ